MHKTSYYLFFLISLICSAQSTKQSVLAWVKNKPFITRDQFRIEVINSVSSTPKNLEDLNENRLFHFNVQVFDQLVAQYFLTNLSPVNKYQFQGVALFMDYIVNSTKDAKYLTEFTQSAKNMNDELKKKTIKQGFGYEVINKRTNEISYLKQWIELHIKEIEEFYKVQKEILTTNNVNIYIPSFENVKNLIGYFLLTQLQHPTPDLAEIGKFMQPMYENALDYELLNYLQIKVNYDEWRKLYDELRILFNLHTEFRHI